MHHLPLHGCHVPCMRVPHLFCAPLKSFFWRSARPRLLTLRMCSCNVNLRLLLHCWVQYQLRSCRKLMGTRCLHVAWCNIFCKEYLRLRLLFSDCLSCKLSSSFFEMCCGSKCHLPSNSIQCCHPYGHARTAEMSSHTNLWFFRLGGVLCAVVSQCWS